MKKILYIVAALGLMFSSCSKENDFENPNSGDGAVQFMASAPTRVTEDSEWQADDRIGVFAGSVSNTEYKIKADNSGVMEYVSGKAIYAPSSSQSYYGYYPYDADINGSKLSVDLVSNQLPLVWAKAENMSGSNVTFDFKHQLVKLNLTFRAGGLDIANLDGATATLKGANTKGEFDVVTGAWNSSATVAEDLPLTIATTEASTTLTIYVMPTTSPNANTTIEISAGSKNFVWQPTTTAWEVGNSYDYDITVKDNLKITITTGDNSKSINVPLSISSTQTRVAVNDDESTDSNWKFEWRNGDGVTAWFENNISNCADFNMDKFGVSLSTFKGDVPLDVEKIRLISPCITTSVINGDKFSINMSQQDGNLNKLYMISDKLINVTRSEVISVTPEMKHLGAIMVVDVYLENPIADKTYKLKMVKYSSNTNAINNLAEIDMTKDFDDEWLYKTLHPGTITANMDVTFETAADDPDYLQAITRLNILPSTIRVDQSATVELTIEVYNKVNEELLETLTSSVTLTNTSENELPFDRGTHNFTDLTVDVSDGGKITVATINGVINESI